MNVLARYPLTEEAVNPHVGRPIVAVTHDGDAVPGVLDRIHENHVIFRPFEENSAAIQQWKSKIEKSPAIQQLKRSAKAKTRAWGHGGGYGGGYGYPYGWGYGNYGWGAGWWWIWPLFMILAFVSFPFFW